MSARRRVVVAPDSFKGSLSAIDAARAMERGVLTAWPDAEVVKIPIADGGEGTVAAMVMATGGAFRETTVRGPLGEPVRARWMVRALLRLDLLRRGETLMLMPEELLIRRFRNEPEFPVDRSRCVPGIEPC